MEYQRVDEKSTAGLFFSGIKNKNPAFLRGWVSIKPIFYKP